MLRLYRHFKRFLRPQIYVVSEVQQLHMTDSRRTRLVRRTFLQHFLKSARQRELLGRNEEARAIDFDELKLIAHYHPVLRWIPIDKEVREGRVVWIWHRNLDGSFDKIIGFHRGGEWRALVEETYAGLTDPQLTSTATNPVHIATFAVE